MMGVNEYFGMPVVEDSAVPPGRMIVLPDRIALWSAQRRRWWWKPWTWRRRNVPSGLATIRNAIGR